ncbi:MAG: HAD-IIB family hydrolase [Halanaerobiales bacterium]
MNKLFVSDLDGTLLDNQAELSDYSRKKLNNLIDKGLQFTAASARSVVSMQRILKGLNLRLPVIEFNGAFISDLKTGRHILINEINTEIKYDIFSDIKKHTQFPFISTFNGKRDLLYYVNMKNKGSQWYVNDRTKSRDKRLTQVDTLIDVVDENVVCFTIIDKKEILEELYHILDEKYGKMIELHLMENDYSPGWYWLTIHDHKATKDQAIVELVSITGHKLDELVVFGDNLNDLKMFRKAETAVAVGNAREELIEFADQVIGLNTDDSVVRYINKEFMKC